MTPFDAPIASRSLLRLSFSIVAWCGLGCGLFEERIPDLFPDSLEATAPASVVCASADCNPCLVEAGCGAALPSDELGPPPSRAADAGTDQPRTPEPETAPSNPEPVEAPVPGSIALDPSSVDAGAAPIAPAEPMPPSGSPEPDAGPGMEAGPGPRPAPPPPPPRR